MSLKFKILVPVVFVMVIVMCLITINIYFGIGSMKHRMAADVRVLIGDAVSEALGDLMSGQKTISRADLKKRLMSLRVLDDWLLLDKNKKIIYSEQPPDPPTIYVKHPKDFNIPHQKVSNPTGETTFDLVDEAFLHKQIRVRKTYVAIPIRCVLLDDDTGSGTEIEWVLFGKTAQITDSIDVILAQFFNMLLPVMVLGTCMLLIVIFMLLNRFVLRPVNVMVEEFHRVEEGDYQQSRLVRRYDELGRMMHAFDHLRIKLKNHQAELQAKVDQASLKVQKTEHDLMLAQRINALGLLAAGVAHEINNPLGGMINASRSLRDIDWPDQKTADYLGLIQDGLARIEAIVQRILVFGHSTVTTEPFHFSDIVHEAQVLIQYRLDNERVELTVDIEPDDLMYVGSKLEFTQVLLNLLSNSLDAIDGNGKIAISIVSRDGQCVIELSDDGSGMSKKEQESMFDFFYTTKEPGKGAGLGMGIVYNIVQSHQGEIEVLSSHETGTLIRLILPIVR